MNRTVLLVTHDMDEAIYLSDRILVLECEKRQGTAGIYSKRRKTKQGVAV